MDLSKLSTADKVIAVAGILLLLFSFLDWYGVSGFGGRSGWDYFLFGIIPVLLGLVMVALVALRAFSPDTKLPDLPLGWGQVMLILGAIAAALVVIKLAIGDEICIGIEGFGEECGDLDREPGIFLAALAAIGLAVGGFLKMQEPEASAPSGPSQGGSAPF